MFEKIRARFSSRSKFKLSHSSLGSGVKRIVKSPEAKIAGDLSNLTKELSIVLLQRKFLISKFIYSANSESFSRSCRFERPTLKLKLVTVFKRSPSNIKNFLLTPKFNILLYRVTGTFPCIKNTFILAELRPSVNLNWFSFSSLKRLTKEEAKYGAIIPLSFIDCKTFSFNFPSAFLFLIEVSVIFFLLLERYFLVYH